MEEQSITIDGVQLNADELSNKGKLLVNRLQMLANEKNILLLKLQEKDIVLQAFQNQLIKEYQGDTSDQPAEKPPTKKSKAK